MQSMHEAPAVESRSELSVEDVELIAAAKAAADRLHVDDVHEVAAAVRTKDKRMFTGIHIEASVGYADVCVAKWRPSAPQSHRGIETLRLLWLSGETEQATMSC
jgi:cytidine deaminase